MDDPNIDDRALEKALRHLALCNRVTGATRLVLRQFQRWSRTWGKGDPIRILDIGTGSADIPRALDKWATKNGLPLRITAIDLHPKSLAIARRKIGARQNIDLLQMNALKLMDHFEPRSFDYVHAGLFLHHLEEIEVLTVLRIMDRLATRGMIWNDLRRSLAMKLVFRSMAWTGPAVFRHDAIASIDAAFTKREALDLVHRAGWPESGRVSFRGWLFHRFLIVGEKG